MENFDWKLVMEGISTLAKALPDNEKVRRWVVIGTVVVVVAAAIVASQASNKQSS